MSSPQAFGVALVAIAGLSCGPHTTAKPGAQLQERIEAFLREHKPTPVEFPTEVAFNYQVQRVDILSEAKKARVAIVASEGRKASDLIARAINGGGDYRTAIRTLFAEDASALLFDLHPSLEIGLDYAPGVHAIQYAITWPLSKDYGIQEAREVFEVDKECRVANGRDICKRGGKVCLVGPRSQ